MLDQESNASVILWFDLKLKLIQIKQQKLNLSQLDCTPGVILRTSLDQDRKLHFDDH